MPSLKAIFMTALPALTFACVTVQAPPVTGGFANVKQAIGEAEGAGADKTPQAELHLKMARDQLAQAERMLRDEKDDHAGMMLVRAESDARLALALAREAEARTAAQDAMARIHELQN